MQNLLPCLAKGFAEKAYEVIDRVDGPLIVHTFSNGGFFTFSSVLQHSHVTSGREDPGNDRFGCRVEKVIFDSCPSLQMQGHTLAGCDPCKPY
jgi:hypothetical protein